MEGLTNLLGEAGTVGYIVLATLILMFFISPILSIFMQNTIRSRTATTLGIAIALGIFSGLTVLLSYGLPDILGEETINQDGIAIISLVISLIIALPAGMWISWMFSNPQEITKFNADDTSNITSPLSFEAKKHKRLKKKSRR